MFFLSHCCQSPFPLWESQSTSPPQDALQHGAGLWTCCGAAQVLIWSYSCLSLPPVSTAIRTSVFSPVGALSGLLSLPQSQGLSRGSCGFNLQLVHLVGGFGVFLLGHTAPGFQLWFYSHLCMWVVHWGLLLRLPWRTWLCPCKGQCGGGAAAWVTGVLAAPGTQGGWRLGQQEI